MNCPNCGGTLDIKNKHCEYCNTTFTYEELYPSKEVHKETSKTEVVTEPEKPKTLTEQRQEELRKEKANRPKETYDTSSREIMTGAAVMGCFSLFSGVRRFFRELKRTVCLIVLVALEIGFGYVMLSGTLSNVTGDKVKDFAIVNGVILANALLAGIICRIGRLRFGTVLVGIVNFLAVVWVFAYPLIKSDFEGVSPQNVAILAVVEMIVIALSILFTYLISKRHY